MNEWMKERLSFDPSRVSQKQKSFDIFYAQQTTSIQEWNKKQIAQPLKRSRNRFGCAISQIKKFVSLSIFIFIAASS